MFQKNLALIVVASLLASTAAVAAPAKVTALEKYVHATAEKTGRSEDEVRDTAIEVLRQEGKYKEADLERIGRGKADFSPARQREMINLLKASEGFSARTGLADIRNDSIRKDADAAFSAMTAPRAGTGDPIDLLPAANNIHRAVKAMWQEQIDSVISSGTLFVSGVGINLPELEKLDAKKTEQIGKGLLAKTYSTLFEKDLSSVLGKPQTKIAVFSQATVTNIAKFLGTVNDYSEEFTKQQKPEVSKLVLATLHKIGMEGAGDNILVVTTNAKVDDSDYAAGASLKVRQVTFINKDTGLGFTIFMQEGHM